MLVVMVMVVATGSITSQGTQDQQDEWVARCMILDLYGCMAMTVSGLVSWLHASPAMCI